MKTAWLTGIVLCFCMVMGWGEEGGTADPTFTEVMESADTPPWLNEISKVLVKETGVAISPVIGLSYLAITDDPSVAHLKPWVWAVIGLFVLVLVKDVGGVALPGLLKKPLDAVEFFQNQGLGALCAALFVPDLHRELYALVADHAPAAQWAGDAGAPFFLAATGSEGILYLLTFPLAIAIFCAVWLLSNTINVLILLSPFSTVDACLKSIKVACLGVLAGLGAIHPYLGAGLSVILVIVAFLLFGWAFRLYHFGWIFASDLITRRHKRFHAAGKPIRGFLDQELADVPARTYGELSHHEDSGTVRFRYRPWLLMAPRDVSIPLTHSPKVGRGLVHVTIEATETDGDLDTYFHLPPRYSGHERVVGKQLDLEVVDIGIRRGVKVAMRWVRRALRRKPQAVA